MVSDDIEKIKEEHIKSKLLTIGEVSSYIFHDINNYLFVLVMNIDMIKMNIDPENKKKEKIFKSIDKASDNIEKINEVFERLKEEIYPLSNSDESFDIYSVTGDFIKFYRKLDKKMKISITGESKLVRGSQGCYLQILLQILNNIKEANDDLVNVDISIESNPEKIKLLIKEDGVGISYEIMKRVFSKEYTTKEKPLGLGLDIAMKLSRKMNAEMKYYKEDHLMVTDLEFKKG